MAKERRDKNPEDIVAQLLEENIGLVEKLIHKCYGNHDLAYIFEDSELWARPQYNEGYLDMYPAGFLQVVGHTPVAHISSQGELLTTDTFSATSTGRAIGDRNLCIVDTVTKEWREV
ncbi:MAG: hypothetical protein K5745_04825 [Saccharofermentans sp.]|nr:hypothetical protein [Saccharofermentans sp.]